MLDVHPPHHAVSGWRDFFVHIATIAVGLLIAVGIEQTVEAIHHHHQREQLYEGMHADATQELRDIEEDALAAERHVEDLTARVGQVQQSLAHHQIVGPPSYRPDLPVDTIAVANLEGAKSSGLLQLLPQEEIATILSEAEVGAAKALVLKNSAEDSTRRRLVLEQRFQMGLPAGAFDFSSATPVQMEEYLHGLLEERLAWATFKDYLDLMHRGARAFLDGRHTIETQRAAQRPTNPAASH